MIGQAITMYTYQQRKQLKKKEDFTRHRSYLVLVLSMHIYIYIYTQQER